MRSPLKTARQKNKRKKTPRKEDKNDRTLHTTEKVNYFARDFMERTERAGAGQSSGNTIIELASVAADASRAIATELVDLVRHSTERSIDHMEAMTRCRSPEGFINAQADAMRDNAEMVMDTSRRIAEIAQRTADESSHIVGRNLKPN